MKYFRKITAVLFTPCLLLLCCPSAFAEETPVMWDIITSSSGNITVAVLGLIIIIAMLIGIIFAAKCGKDGRADLIWSMLAMLLTAAALITGVVGYNFGTLYTRVDDDPAETVAEFFNAVKTGDYVTAYACISDYTGLGLENAPADGNGVKIYSAMKEAFDYSFSGTAQTDRLKAVVPVALRYLDIRSTESKIEELVNTWLEKTVAENPRNTVYDANDKYLPEVTDKAYAYAVDAVLSDAQSYYKTVQLDIELEYTDGQWLILSSPALLNALIGGTAQ